MDDGARIPILKLGHLLLVTIQVDMHDRMAVALQEDLTRRIVETGARGVLIDISGLELVDSFIGRMLADIAGDGARAGRRDRRRRDAARRWRSRSSSSGLSLPGVRTALTVERGMGLLPAPVSTPMPTRPGTTPGR